MSIETAVIDARSIHRANDTFVEDWGGLGAPEPRRVTQSRPRTHGAIDTTSLYGPRVMPVRGWCGKVPAGSGGVAAALAAFDALKGVLLVSTSHLAVIRRMGRGADEQMVVRVASDVSDEVLGGGHVIRWGVELIAPDPRLYSTTLSSQQRTGAGSIAVDHSAGTVETPAYLQVEGPTNAGTLTLANSTTAETITLTGLPALSAGQLLDVDTNARTVYYGSLYHPEAVVAFSTYWWSLVPGVNTVTVGGTAVVSGTTTRVRWRTARI